MDVSSEELRLIILRAKQGDRTAFDALYRMYATPVYRYVFMRVRNSEDAEDIMQETFLKVYQALPRYRDERATMLPYLFTVARNLLINHGKKKRPEQHLPEEIDRYSAGDDTSKMATDGELAREIGEAMEALSVIEREVVTLKFFGEQSYAEIADILDKREDAIRQHVARAMKKMKTSMTHMPQ